jgi:ribose 1,5-bisphosphokinase
MDARPANPEGCMVAVVGPSGAGKDTLMAYAAASLKGRGDIVFVRRVITRNAASGGEDHDGVSDAEFDAMEQSSSFSVSWRAHGLRYGIPASARDAVTGGMTVIANGSRSALPHFKAAYPRLVVINITARPEVLAARLEARGRESREDIRRRLERSNLSVGDGYEVVTIDNSGSVDTAGDALIQALQNLNRTSR